VYRHILGLLEDFCGQKAKYVLAVGLVVLAVSLLMLLLPPWRRAVKAAWEKGGWRGIVLGLANGLMSLVVGSTIVAALGGALLVQSGLFDEQHGRVTQANYEAIQTKWGQPHEQRELGVTHFITKEQTIFLLRDGREIIKDGEDAGDLAPAAPAAPVPAPPLPPTDGPAAAPKAEGASADEAPDNAGKITTFKRKARRAVPQNSIVRGQIDVDIRMNYRQQGPAYYTCYDDAWKFDYTVKNRCDKATEAEFRFSLPAEHGLYSDFVIQVNGQDWAEHLVLRDNAQTWAMPMKPGEEARVEIAYRSRGMEHLRYMPAHLAHRENYQVRMRIFPHGARDKEPALGPQQFQWLRDMALPIGCMSPTAKSDSEADGKPLVMEWDLTKTATTLGMGVILPKIKPPGYYVTRLLHDAPLGLALLAGLLVITWTFLGRETDLVSLGLLVIIYYLFYTFIAYLSDILTSFPECFLLAAGATLLAAGLYLWLGWGRNFVSHQTLALMAAFTIYYPIAVVQGQTEYAGLLTQVLYWTLAVYVAMLTVVMVWRGRRAAT
jgi:hypothetical protein